MLTIQQILSKYIKYYEKDVYRINHMLKVYSFARNIAVLEGLDEDKLKLVEVSSILHDIGIKGSEIKYGSSSGRYQEIEGPPLAKEWLDEFKLEESFIERVCYLLGHHHSYSFIDDMDFQILVEADFLVNIYEDKIAEEQASLIREKYFKTKAGKELLDSIY
jgi:HD superfamily phosphodiesterase